MSHRVPTVTSPPWGPTTKRIVALVALVALYLLLVQIHSIVWTAMIVTLVLGYLLSPLVRIFERRLAAIRDYGMRRTVAVIMTWLLLLALLGLLIGLIVPATVQQLRSFAEQLPDLMSDTERDVKAWLNRPVRVGGYELVPWEELQQFLGSQEGEGEDASITSTLQDSLLSLADPAADVLGGAVTFLVTTVLVIVMLFYLMRDGPMFVEYIVGGVPESYQGDLRRVLHELGLIWNGYLRGQLLLGLAIATITYVTALLLGLPNPLLLAIVAGFLEFIPNIGPTLAAVPAVLFAFTTDSSTIASLDSGLLFASVVTLAYFLIQQLEAIFLVPRVMGHSLGLHPLVVLASIFVASSIFGLLGVVLAAPMIATLRLFGRYLRGKLLDEDAFPSALTYPHEHRGWIYRLMQYFLHKRFPLMPAELPGAETPSELRDQGDSWAR